MDSDDELFASPVKRTKRKKGSKTEESSSLLDELIAEDKARVAKLAEIREETEKSVARADFLTGSSPSKSTRKKSLSPFAIDWDYINAAKKVSETADVEKKQKRKKKKGFFNAMPLGESDSDDDDDEDPARKKKRVEVLEVGNDDIFGVTLPSRLERNETRAAELLSEAETALEKSSSSASVVAFREVLAAGIEDDIIEAFSYVSSSRGLSDTPGVLSYLHTTAFLDKRLKIAEAAATALSQCPNLVLKADDIHTLLDAIVVSPPLKKQSDDERPSPQEDPRHTVERLGRCLRCYAEMDMEAAPFVGVAKRIISDICSDKIFAASLTARGAARTFVAAVFEAATHLETWPCFFEKKNKSKASSPVETFIALRLLPLEASAPSRRLTANLLIEALSNVLLSDTPFATLLPQNHLGDDDLEKKATLPFPADKYLDHVAAALATLERDEGGGISREAILGSHERLHAALACVHKLYWTIAPDLHYSKHQLLLEKAQALKLRFRQELDPMAVRSTDLLDGFISDLARSAAPPVKKQLGMAAFTTAKKKQSGNNISGHLTT